MFIASLVRRESVIGYRQPECEINWISKLEEFALAKKEDIWGFQSTSEICGLHQHLLD